MVSEAAGGSPPFRYLTRTPSAPLRRFVETIWFARGTVPYTRERIAPTGSSVGIIILGDPLLVTPDDGAGETLRAEDGLLLGPHDGPVVNEPAGETFALGVIATPVGCLPTFGVSPRSFRGDVVELTQGWHGSAVLREMLLQAEAAEEQLGIVERHLLGSLGTVPASTDLCEAAVAMLENEPTRPIGDIAAALAVSHGHLDREFTAVVGLSPRALARLLRMRRLLAGLDVSGDIPWADLSAELGWYDQAHLIRDFKRHTGVSPSAYVRAQRSTLAAGEPGDAAGFVPEF